MILIPVYQGSLYSFLFGKNIFLSEHMIKNLITKKILKQLYGWLAFILHGIRLFLTEITCFFHISVFPTVYIFFLWLLFWRFFCLLKDMLIILLFHIVSFSVWAYNILLMMMMMMMMMVCQIRYCFITTR